MMEEIAPDWGLSPAPQHAATTTTLTTTVPRLERATAPTAPATTRTVVRPDPPPGAPTGPKLNRGVRGPMSGLLPTGTKVCTNCARHGHLKPGCRTRIVRTWEKVRERTPRRGLEMEKARAQEQEGKPRPGEKGDETGGAGKVTSEGGTPTSTVGRIRVGTKGGWTLKYDKDPGSKVKEKKKMTEVLGRYKQFEGIKCTNIGWRPEYPKEKLYTFEVADRANTDPGKTVVSVRSVVEKDLQITAAPFGDWVELVVKAVDAGKNTTAEDYANRIVGDNSWICARAPREAIWLGQERGFSINEGKRCDRKITIRTKEAIPETSNASERWSFGSKVIKPGMRLYREERRGNREGYQNEEGQWVAWAKPGDPPPQRRIPDWKLLCYEK